MRKIGFDRIRNWIGSIIYRDFNVEMFESVNVFEYKKTGLEIIVPMS